jgi:hypothetical protein
MNSVEIVWPTSSEISSMTFASELAKRNGRVLDNVTEIKSVGCTDRNRHVSSINAGFVHFRETTNVAT